MFGIFGQIKRTLIKSHHFSGGQNITDKSALPTRPSLNQILHDLVTDVLAIQPPKPTASAVASITAMTSAAITGGESPTEAEHNALRTDVVNLRAHVVELRTLANELRTNALAAGKTATALTVTSANAQTYNLSSTSGYTFTFELENKPMSLTVTAAIIAANAAVTTAVTADELVTILEQSGLRRMGLIPSVSGSNEIVLTAARAGVDVTCDTFAGTLETVLDFTGGTTVAGTGYQMLVYKE